MDKIELVYSRSVARKETVDVHKKNWVCHMYCQMNAKKNKKIKHAYWVLICQFNHFIFV